MSIDIEALRTWWANDLDHRTWKDGPIEIIGADPDRTWIWSDLHLSDRGALEAFDRPFRNIHAMNRELLANWRRSVHPSDTIICLGDVAHPDAAPAGAVRHGPAAGPESLPAAAHTAGRRQPPRPPARGRRADAAAHQPGRRTARLPAATPPRRARQGTPSVAAGKRVTTAAALT